ncbi:MAG: ABC transporter permease [Acidimicrobiia bacterium]
MPEPLESARADPSPSGVDHGPGPLLDAPGQADAPGPGPGPGDATTEEMAEFGVEVRSQWRLVLSRFLHHRLAVAGLMVLLVLVTVSFLGETLSGYGYDEVPFDADAPLNSGPSTEHWFGTNELGVDVFSQVQRGAQRSIQVGFLIALFATTFGSLVGAIAGFYRGWVDTVLMRFTDLFLTIPTLAVLIVVANRFRDSENAWFAIVLVISALAWMGLARIVRGVALSLREREFVEAARAVGVSNRRIVVRHILPNCLGPIIVAGTLAMAGGILAEAALSFLGFGIQPPDVSLGGLIAVGVPSADERWWLFYPPGLFILLFCLAINFIGDGLRDAFDPQQTRVRQ